MRYIIETMNEEGLIGMQLAKWETEEKITIIEKGLPVEQVQAQLQKVQAALEVLRVSGFNTEVLSVWLKHKTQLPMRDVYALLKAQDEFFRNIGFIPKKK